ncbi:MAG: N-acetyl-gamma-glutamyl-phosphate reductase [Coriobacteriaceae bacterium]|nr:N-acetyl-gamma-glutamyl-phosphate reductase [Coriobacteriaceae bacterium]
MSIKAGIVGAAGFAGIEAARLVLTHPEFELVAATSNELAGCKLSDLYPNFLGVTDLAFTAHDDAPLTECDVVFLAVPHTAAIAQAPALVQAGVAVIDLSADFRLKDPAVYEQWYKVKHTATDLLAQAAFGLPELFGGELRALASRRESGQGVLVGCAGCYPTATSLAAAPLIRAGLVGEGPIVADAVSGVSGAGKKATERTHFCFADENVEAYGVGSHRHTPEIEQILGIEGRLVFTPHLAPLDRGLLSTVTLPLGESGVSQEQLDGLYTDFYADAPLVSVLTGGAQPKTSSVAGTCRAHVAAVYNAHANVVVATGAIDNVGKGAAGQAVQCANIVFGLPETIGLEHIAIPA